MPPNWSKFQSITQNMIESMLGGMPCTVETPSSVSYNYETGESEQEMDIKHVNMALIPLNKDDLKDLPEGYRDKKVLKVFTVDKLDGASTITTDFDGLKYEIIVPSVAYTAGGLTHCYRTILAKIETLNYSTGDNN